MTLPITFLALSHPQSQSDIQFDKNRSLRSMNSTELKERFAPMVDYSDDLERALYCKKNYISLIE